MNQAKREARMAAEREMLDSFCVAGSHVISGEQQQPDHPWEDVELPTHAICLGEQRLVVFAGPTGGGVIESGWDVLTTLGKGKQPVSADPDPILPTLPGEQVVARARSLLAANADLEKLQLPAADYPRLCAWCASGRHFSGCVDRVLSRCKAGEREETAAAEGEVSPTPALRENREKALLAVGEDEVRQLLQHEHQYSEALLACLLPCEALALVLLEEGFESPRGNPAAGMEGDWLDVGVTRALLDNTFFPGKGRDMQYMLEAKGFQNKTSAEYRAECLAYFGGQACTIATLDDRKLEGFWSGPCDGGEAGKACIVFHPNFAVGLDMVRHGQWYRTRGFSVLLVTMGGYAGSEGDTTELTTYLDAHAAVQHVHVQHGVSLERILCHGCSIGGALATAAAYMHPGVHCTVDQTFVNAREVAENLVGSQEGSWIQNTPLWLIDSFVDALFPSGISHERLPNIVTDGYDNEAKAAQLKGGYFVFWADRDQMMPPGYATRLLESYLEGQRPDDAVVRIACVQGGRHGAWFFENGPAVGAYSAYLTHLGLGREAQPRGGQR